MEIEWKTYYTSSHINNKVKLNLILMATVYWAFNC